MSCSNSTYGIYFTLREHADALSVSQAVSQSRKSRGLFAWLFWNKKPSFKPRYNHRSDGGACRITGSLTVKRVTGMYRLQP